MEYDLKFRRRVRDLILDETRRRGITLTDAAAFMDMNMNTLYSILNCETKFHSALMRERIDYYTDDKIDWRNGKVRRRRRYKWKSPTTIICQKSTSGQSETEKDTQQSPSDTPSQK